MGPRPAGEALMTTNEIETEIKTETNYVSRKQNRTAPDIVIRVGQGRALQITAASRNAMYASECQAARSRKTYWNSKPAILSYQSAAEANIISKRAIYPNPP